MKRLLLWLLFTGMLYPVMAQYNSKNLKVGYQNFADQLTYGKLRIYPILANQEFLDAHKGIGNYQTLEKALQTDQVRITEKGGGGRQTNMNEDIQINQIQDIGGGGVVNSLMIENTSNDTVFIMAGEVIKGGKQDRVIAQDLRIPPKSGKIDLSVFCVEQGRWSYGGNTDGKFSGYGNVSSINVRKAAVKDKNQSQVWANVAEVTEANNAQSSTGTYNELENSAEFQAELKKYVAHFTSLPSDKNVIGIVGVSGDKVIGCDMFATHDLFKSQYKALVYAYATEAISNGKEVTAGANVVESYLTELLDESRQDAFIEENGLKYETASKKLHINTYAK